MSHRRARGVAKGNQPMRVLFVSVASKPAGAERSLAVLFGALGNDDTALAVVAPRAGLPAEALACSGIRWFRTCRFEPVRRPGLLVGCLLAWRWLRGVLAVLRAIRRFRPDIVHANTTAAMLVAMFPARWLGRPIVWHVRDLIELGAIGRFSSRRASAIIAVSRSVLQHLLAQGIAPDKIRVVHNGVEASFGKAEPVADVRQRLRTELGCPPTSFVYVNVGQFVPFKRQDVFLHAAARVARICPRARFMIVGQEPPASRGRLGSQLEALVRELDLSQRVTIHNWRDDVALVLAGADALVHTATAEPFGRVIIEAMHVGLPVVAVRAAGPAEIVEHEQTGLLAEPDDVEGLALLMRRVQEHPSLADRLGEAGRRRVAEKFTAERTAHGVRDLYRQILSEGTTA